MSGNGNPPMGTAQPPELALIVAGSAFFAILLIFATRIVFPIFFKRWFPSTDVIINALVNTIFIPDTEGPTLAKQVAELKNELHLIRSSLLGSHVETDANLNKLEVHPDLAIDVAIASRIQRDSGSMDLAELLELRHQISYASQQKNAQEDLEIAMDAELRSAKSIKKNMLNFFIGFNFILITSFAIQSSFSQKDLSASAYQGITALYISLAVFIVYVYRAANARVLILLAGKEDTKRVFNAERYLSSRPKSLTSERDVEVLKLLLTNRMERERGSEHPYELVLKGITNSNVLVKGGRVTSIPKQRSE